MADGGGTMDCPVGGVANVDANGDPPWVGIR
jgi:hypothetical protein